MFYDYEDKNSLEYDQYNHFLDDWGWYYEAVDTSGLCHELTDKTGGLCADYLGDFVWNYDWYVYISLQTLRS